MTYKLLMAASVFALGMGMTPTTGFAADMDASATTTVTTTTETTPVVTEPATIKKTTISTTDKSSDKYTFVTFDMDGDGTVTKAEVGEKLFYIYDVDGNEVIDNLEWDNKKVMTIVPMEKKTLTYVDSDDDGVAEQEDMTYEKFMIESNLIKFNDDLDGLSAEEFIGKDFAHADYDRDNFIDVKEWRKTYVAMLRKGDQELERYINSDGK